LLLGGVLNIINQIFDQLEATYGPLLVRAAIAFIALSARGVSSSEIVELLSLDEEVMAAVTERNKADRLPTRKFLMTIEI